MGLYLKLEAEMTKVWHRKSPSFDESLGLFPGDYELVAEVASDNLEVVYEKTNHIHCVWWENEGVTLVKESRSTSVGDVAEVNGKLFLCAMMGWKEVKGN
jgi:hypothetical protein